MLNLKMGHNRSWWSLFAVSFILLISIASAIPQSSGRRGGAGNREIKVTIDGQPEITLPCDGLYAGSDIIYVPVMYPISIRTAQVISGPPDIGLLFVNTRGGSSDFVSQAIYAPENKARFPSGTSAMRGPFANPNYIALFRLPSGMDQNRMVVALTNSEDDAEPNMPDAGFHLWILNFAGPGVTGVYAVERFDKPITIQQAALIHASDPKAKINFYNEQKNLGVEITMQDQLKTPFNRAMFIVGGESPPPGPLLSREDLKDL